MWVFIRPRGGQDCYLLVCEIRGGPEFCPIHRFNGMDQILMRWSEAKQKMKYEKNIVLLYLGRISRSRKRILLRHHCSKGDCRPSRS
jgi:hypothetical protein